MAGNLDNWIARYTGYIRITEAGVYRFSNLYNDGFFLDIYGAPGQKVSNSQDYLNQVNRRQGEDLLLGVGLYAFELGSWERLEAGVIDLRWLRPGQSSWELVPSTHLLASVPLPGTLAFGALGALLGLGFGRRGRTADKRR